MSAQLARVSERLPTGSAAACSEESDIWTQMKVELDSFRLADGVPYRRMTREQRAAIPKIRDQVSFLQFMTTSFAKAVERDTDDPELASARLVQVSELALHGIHTYGLYTYKKRDYGISETNPCGDYVRWRVRRAVGPLFHKALGLYPPNMRQDPEVRRLAAQSTDVGFTAANESYHAKLGLGCIGSLPVLMSSAQALQEAAPKSATPDVLGLFADRTAIESYRASVAAVPELVQS